RCKTGRNVLRSPEGIMRTNVLHKVGYYRADLPHSADFEMWMRAATVSDVGYIVGADQAYYRFHEGNMHHAVFDRHSDISERLRVYDIVLSENSDLLRDANSLRDAAHQALAREALGNAMSEYARGVAEDESIDEWVRFALDTWGETQSLREWRALSRIRN